MTRVDKEDFPRRQNCLGTALQQHDLCFYCIFLTNKYQIDGESPVCLFVFKFTGLWNKWSHMHFYRSSYSRTHPVLWLHEALRVYSKNRVWMNFVCGKEASIPCVDCSQFYCYPWWFAPPFPVRWLCTLILSYCVLCRVHSFPLIWGVATWCVLARQREPAWFRPHPSRGF